jgi:basic membrane protein A and related proteins
MLVEPDSGPAPMHARAECHKLVSTMRGELESLAREDTRLQAVSVTAAVAALVLVLFGLSAASPRAASTPSTGVGSGGCAAAERLPARRLRVGVVLTGELNSPFEKLLYGGLQRAVRELGVDGRALVLGPKETGLASFSYLARQGFDVVVGDALTIEAMDAAALRFPGTCFVNIDARVEAFPHRPANVGGTIYRVEQAAYLAGYLGALVERQEPGRHVVSSIGGAKVPPVDRFIAGFQAGARKADPNVTILNDYAQIFSVPSRCRQLALHQIAQGSGVLFQVAGTCGLGALQAAKEKHVWGIGVDADESSVGPQVMTSVLKNLDVALVRAIRSILAGTFRAGTNATLSLRNCGVGLGKISPRVPRALVTKMERVRRQVLAGRIAVPVALD